MALWEFVTLTVLIGALLVYAGVIARRAGRADARLKRIEDALFAKSRSVGSANTRAAESKPESSAGQEGRGSYFIIRDLRQLSAGTTRFSTRNSISGSEGRDTVKTTHGAMRSPSASPQREGSVANSSPIREALKGRGARLSSDGTRPLTVKPVPPSLERRDVPATNGGPQSPPDCRSPGGDSVAKKNHDMTLFLSNQSRRRRARLGY